jgi:hypothetical protein
MASSTPGPWDAAPDGRPSVASELAAIFAPLPRPVAAPASAKPAAMAARPGRRIPLWVILLGAVALAALIGSLAFLTPLTRRTVPEPPARSTSPRPAPPPVATALPAAQPAIMPSVPRPAPRRVAAPTHQRVAAASAPTRTRTPVRAPSPTPTPAPSRGDRCPRNATEAWCLHGTITNADNDLRDAYQDAVRAGVDRDLLVDVRGDWQHLRGRANRDPHALIRGYAALARQLRDATRRARR